MFSKVLVANRGEIAVRVIRACREMGLQTVAVHSTADRNSRAVQMADETICIGPPAAKESYLNIANVVSAAVVSGAGAIHPGYGFLSENSSFAEICQQANIKFIGPPPSAIDTMGNKASARAKMREAGVPIMPGTPGIIETEREALDAARQIGFPVIIKASAGGGGKGMRVVLEESELVTQLNLAKNEAEAAFGNDEVYIEKYLIEPRHVEVQILADSHGNVIHLGERDCSVQTARHQKMLEEAPCAFIPESTRRKLGEAAVKGAKSVGYESAGTIEFLVSATGEFFFMEMNTRIQVEHPVTEEITGIDLIQEQIRIAQGAVLSWKQKDVTFSGHAIEVRLTAEDPEKNFAPSAGTIAAFDAPGGRGVRVDSHLYTGYAVPPFYDSLLAKIIVHAPTREEAIAKMDRALRETRIEGVATTRDFQRKILANEYFQRGELSTDFLKRRMSN
ncbi:acetyl-CoA carboxylase, biotin carboxylase subunit [Abditibacterium utsteinense]|uniref:Biotin carboxylase n=1 Tax=Abditibacterium utsteinense TaxID=1960156 RepID=A0A2S8SWQ9_9BACT|nr:acetyl-CoA carboxylase biotin carboxylase subunit [Abditibacterium utsteinense]PQV65235.1 acetyl-CoA carboxylase, biotin carboxylase subunit [Abditibacterium utsteinense]